MVTPPAPRHNRPCVVEVHIPGLLYVRVERCPRWLPHLLISASSALGGWLVARHPWLLQG